MFVSPIWVLTNSRPLPCGRGCSPSESFFNYCLRSKRRRSGFRFRNKSDSWSRCCCVVAKTSHCRLSSSSPSARRAEWTFAQFAEAFNNRISKLIPGRNESSGVQIAFPERDPFSMCRFAAIYSIAIGTLDQLIDDIPGSIERRTAILSINSFCLPRVDISARSRVRSLPG